jgi:DNA-binding transcriptional MerR regulator
MRISEAAKVKQISVTTLRGWEKKGFLCPARTPLGYRDYGPEDLIRIQSLIKARQAVKKG